MISNLLDKSVVQYDTNIVGKICAIDDDFRVIFVTTDGVFHICGIQDLKLCEDRFYSVYFQYDANKKIMAIKVLREITGLDLKQAKDIVDANYTVPVKENLTYDEALAIKEKLNAAGMRVEIRKNDN